MHYPIYVHQDGDSAFGATFPDIPGCFTAADSIEDLPAAAQEAVEVHFDGETDAIPAPSTVAQLKDQAEFVGGFWMLVDIDLSKINTASERVNVSFPGNVLRRIDQYAEQRGMTRSGFLTVAAARMMDEGVAFHVLGNSMAPMDPMWQTREALAKQVKQMSDVADSALKIARTKAHHSSKSLAASALTQSDKGKLGISSSPGSRKKS